MKLGMDSLRERWERLTTVPRFFLLFGFVIAFAILPWFLTSFWQALLVDTMLYVLLALGLNVVVGFAGLLDLGFVAFYAIGHYTVAVVTAGNYSRELFLEGCAPNCPPAPEWMPWMWLLFFAAIGVAMITGVILGGPTLRLRGDYLAIVTLGFGEIVRIAARNFDSVTIGSRGITKIPHPVIDVGPFQFAFGLNWHGYFYLLLALTIVMILMIVRLNNSRIGRAWHAIREDEVAAAATGVQTVRMKLWAFAIGASTAGIAGAVQASRIGYVSPDSFTLLISIFILCMVVLGGMGSIPGAIIGAGVVWMVPEFIRTRSPEFQEYRFLVFGAVLVIMMIYRPQGLIPSKRRAIELTEGETRDGTVYETAQSPSALQGDDVGPGTTTEEEQHGAP